MPSSRAYWLKPPKYFSCQVLCTWLLQCVFKSSCFFHAVRCCTFSLICWFLACTMAEAPPTCRTTYCTLPCAKHSRRGRDFHRHCCYLCHTTDGQEHNDNCYHWERMAHIEWATFTGYTISHQRSQAPCRKKARNHAPSHGDALHPSVEFSMLENYILDICASEPGVADHWKYLFRKWKSAKGFAKS